MLNPAEKMQSDLPTEDLIARINLGDCTALEQLMRTYNQRLYRAARSILRNELEAEEAVQDTYLKVWQKGATFRGDAQVSTWLTRICINEALGRRRKQVRRAEIVQFEPVPNEVTRADEGMPMQTHAPDTPERAVQRADVRRLIECHIDNLPEAFRSVFVLRALEELSVEETAQCLDIPSATVRSRFFRARGQLREALAREIDLSMDEAFNFAGARCDRIVANVLAIVTST